MGVELGELKYVIEANTKQLDEAVKSINAIVQSLDSFTKKLSTVFNTVAKVQEKTKQSTEKASNAVKQTSKAATRNLSSQRQQVKELTKEYDFLKKKILEINGPVEILGRTSRSLKSLKNIMKDNSKSVVEVNAALRRTQGVFRRAQRDLAEFSAQQKRLEQKTRAAESAISKQETALSRAKIRVRGVVDELRKLGIGEQEIKKIGKEFAKFQKKMREGELTTLEFAKAQNRFNERIDVLKRKAIDASNNTGIFQKRMQELTKTVQIALGPLSGVAARLTAFTALATASNIAIALLSAGIVTFSVSLIRLANIGKVVQEQFFNLKSLLEATGKEGLITLNQIDKITRAQAKLTLSSTRLNRTLSGIFLASNLPTRPELLNKFLQLAQGISDLSGGTVRPESAANKLVRLFEDPANNIQTLAEIGIRFTKVQEQIIKNYIDMGEKGKALQIIFDRINVVQKASEDRAKGFTGALDTLGETITEVLEKISIETGILQPFTNVINFLTDAIATIGKSSLGLRVLNTFIRALIGSVTLLASSLGTLLTVAVALTPVLSVFAVFKVAKLTSNLFRNALIKLGSAIFGIVGLMKGLLSTIKIYSVLLIDAAKQATTVFIASLATLRKAIAAAATALLGLVQKAFAAFTAALTAAFPRIMRVATALGVVLAGAILKVAKAFRVLVVTNPIVRIVGIVLLAIGAITALILTLAKGREALSDFSGEFIRSFNKLKNFVIKSTDKALEFLFPKISGDFLIDTEAEERFFERINKIKEAIRDLKIEMQSLKVTQDFLVLQTPTPALTPILDIGDNIKSEINKLENLQEKANKLNKRINDLRKQGIGISDIFSQEDIKKIDESMQNVNDTLEEINNNAPKTEKELTEAFEKTSNAVQSAIDVLDRINKKIDNFEKKKVLSSLREEAKILGDKLVEVINTSARPFLEIIAGINAEKKIKNIMAQYEDLKRRIQELSKTFPEASKAIEEINTLMKQLGIDSKENLALLGEFIKRNSGPIQRTISQMKFQNQIIELQNQKIGQTSEKVRELDRQIKLLETLRNLGIPVQTLDDLNRFSEIIKEIRPELEEVVNKFNELNRNEFIRKTLKDLNNQMAELAIRFQFIGRENSLEFLKALSNFKLRIKAQELGISQKQLDRLIEANNRLQEMQFKFNKLQEISTAIRDSFSSSFNEFIDALIRGENELKAFQNIFISVIETIIKKLLQLLVIDRLANSLGLAISNAFGGLFGGGSQSLGITDSLDFSVNIPSGLNLSNPAAASVPKFASGGIIKSPVGLFSQNKTGIAGESGPEAILPLTKIGGKLGVSAISSSSNIVVNIIDQRSNVGSKPVEVEQRTGPNGLTELRILIRDQIRGMIDSGEFDKNLATNFGIRRKGIR